MHGGLVDAGLQKRDGLTHALKYLYGMRHSRLVRSSWAWSDEDFWSYQAERLAFILGFAVRKIPYYSQRSNDYLKGDIGASSASCPGLLETLLQLPLLDKETVRERGGDLVDPRRPLTMRYHTTSGTTGSPMKIAATMWERSLITEVLSQWYYRLTGRRYPKTLMMRGFWVHSGEDDIFWRSRLTGDTHLSVYSLSADRAAVIADRFDALKPDLIFGYPSALNQLALLIGDAAAGSRDSRVAFVTSEVLQPKWRRNIEELLCSRVYDLYTSEEGSHLVMQCPEGTMHVNPLLGIVEILNDHGSHAECGETGRVVVSGLAKTSMPLIRYDIGDIAISTGYEHHCACGLQWPSLGGIEGREEEQIMTRDGRRFSHLMRFAVKDLEGIRESQLIQVACESFVMKIVANKGYDAELRSYETRIKGEIERRMGVTIDIAFEYVDDISRGENGKFNATVMAASDGARIQR